MLLGLSGLLLSWALGKDDRGHVRVNCEGLEDHIVVPMVTWKDCGHPRHSVWSVCWLELLKTAHARVTKTDARASPPDFDSLYLGQDVSICILTSSQAKLLVYRPYLDQHYARLLGIVGQQ